MQKKQHEKSCEIKGGAQKWLWWSDNGKIFNNNSGKFVISQLFHTAFLHGPHLFLQFGCFCVDTSLW